MADGNRLGPGRPPKTKFGAVSGFLAVAALGFGLGLWWQTSEAQADNRAEPRPVAPSSGLLPAERATVDLFKRASPSVVYIATLARERRVDVFGRRFDRIQDGTGTGFVWDQDGHIVTNDHVVRGAEAAEITLHDKTTWPAKLVGRAPHTDLAVLRIEAPPKKLKPIAVGSSSDLQVGQSVLAIGNPFGFDYTLTTGVISALDREVQSLRGREIRGVIQTDAAINPGNSGGPLLDSSGRLIGVNTQIVSSGGAWSGIGFAIPADTVNWVVPELIVPRPRLGLSLVGGAEIRPRVEGVLVYEVVANSGADRAGMRGTKRTGRGPVVLGDVITAIEGKRVRSVGDVRGILDGKRIGDEVDVTVLRGDQPLRLKVRLSSSR